MTTKTHQEEAKEGDECITVDTPNPEPVEPPPEALLFIQPAVETDEVAIPVTVEDVLIHPIDPDDPISVYQVQQQKPRLCTVIAPSSLDAGYRFPAQVDGIDFMVVVPDGGVIEGQAFQVPYPIKLPSDTGTQPLQMAQSSASNDGDGVKGRWRNELCECCEVCGNGMCCFGFGCAPIMLAQVMTRLKLNLIGSASQGNFYQQTFWWVVGFWSLFCFLFLVLTKHRGLFLVVVVVWLVYHTSSSMNARTAMRQRYEIPAECFAACDGVFEDCCLSFWCNACTIIQMARHTHDTKVYPYRCCTKTGLNSGAPEIV